MNDPLMTLTIVSGVLGLALLVLARVIPDEYDRAIPAKSRSATSPARQGCSPYPAIRPSRSRAWRILRTPCLTSSSSRALSSFIASKRASIRRWPAVI